MRLGRVLRLAVLGCLFGSGLVALAQGNTAKIERLYVFGDSYSDIGEGYLDGNGPTAVAYFAKRLGFELYPSNEAEVKGKSLDFAVSAAQSGSGEGRSMGAIRMAYGMKNQVADFAAMVKSGDVTFDPATTLFYLAGGLNDGGLPAGSTAANEEEEIRTLYGLGARRFAVAVLTLEIPGFGLTGKKINPSLEQIPATVADLKDAKIYVSQWGPFYDRVLTHPAQYGMTNTTDQCADRAFGGKAVTECATPNTYFYYHSQHPSTATHKLVGDMLYEEALEKAGVPAAK